MAAMYTSYSLRMGEAIKESIVRESTAETRTELMSVSDVYIVISRF